MKQYTEDAFRFSRDLCRMYADFCEQDDSMRDTMLFLTEHNKNIVTVSTLAEHIVAVRRVAVRNTKGRVASFTKETTAIGRARAERIVEKLAFAGLVDVTPKLPLKVISLSVRGKQVAMELYQRNETRKGRSN